MSAPGANLDELLDAATDLDVAREIISRLHARTQALQQNSDQLRAELTLHKRGGGGGASLSQLQRARADLRELRVYARKRNLDGDALALVTAGGDGMLMPGIAAMDQTLKIDGLPEDGLRGLRPVFVTPTTRLGELIAMTSSYRLAPFSAISMRFGAEMNWRASGAIAGLGLAKGERVEAVCALNTDEPPSHLLIVTMRGWCRALPWSIADSLLASGQTIAPGDKGDVPAWIAPLDAADADLLLLTRLGRWARFPLRGLEAAGMYGASLEPDDDVCGAVVLNPRDAAIQFVTADGGQFAVAQTGLPAHKRPGAKTQSLARNIVAQACARHAKSGAALLLTMGGDVIISASRALQIVEKPHEARALNVAGARLAAVGWL
jgi:hypothetical protein